MKDKKYTVEVPCRIGDSIWGIIAYMKPIGQSCNAEYEVCQLECAGFEITETYSQKQRVRIVPRFSPHGLQKNMVYADKEQANERLAKLRGAL